VAIVQALHADMHQITSSRRLQLLPITQLCPLHIAALQHAPGSWQSRFVSILDVQIIHLQASKSK
jgi:hypothetical protein